jgi:hypothetical protein
MTVPFGGKVKVRSIFASLAIGLLLAPGCGQEEQPAGSSTKAPPNPVPRADLGRTVEPRLPRTDQGGGSKDISNVEKDLRKDLGSPVIKPDVPTTTAPPVAKPDAAKTGQP